MDRSSQKFSGQKLYSLFGIFLIIYGSYLVL